MINATASGCWVLAVLLALYSSLSGAFLTPTKAALGCLHQHRSASSPTCLSMTARDELGSGKSRSSRRGFLEGGAVGLLASVAVIGLPAPSAAKGIDLSEVKGLDVSEVMHLGAGSSGGKATKPLRDCLLNVERVRISTKQLEDTLTNDGAPPGLTGLVKGLIKNYKLDESLQQGAKYIESSGDRNAAASAGREALEYLAQTAEYFPVELDDRTGAPKKLSSEALEFTVNALIATRAKLDLFLSKVPSDALAEARAEIKSESGDQS
ncbi:unnamed protein product [Ectocarpus sp. 4 AP-2014]